MRHQLPPIQSAAGMLEKPLTHQRNKVESRYLAESRRIGPCPAEKPFLLELALTSSSLMHNQAQQRHRTVPTLTPADGSSRSKAACSSGGVNDHRLSTELRAQRKRLPS